MKKILLWCYVTINIFLFVGMAYSESKSVFLFHSEIMEGYYDSSKQEGKFGYNASLSPSIFYKLNDKNTLFSNYVVSYEETNQVIEEEGVRWTDRILAQTVILGHIYKLSERLENKISVIGYLELSQGTKDENLNTGLYNYWDIGLKDKIRYRTGFKNKPLVFTIGYKFYYRRFLNYEGLYYLIYKKGPRWEKDYFGNRISANAEILLNEKTYSSLQLTYLWKIYADDLVMVIPSVEEDYPYSTKKRQEHVLNFELSYNYSPWRWLSLNVMLSPEWRRGNQNYYDTDRLVFIPHVYDYDLYSGSINSLIKPWKKLLWQTGYKCSYKCYTNTLAYDKNGDYTDDKLYKLDHSISLNISYPVYRNINVVANFFWDFSLSNTEYERIYGYNYQSASYGLGIDYKF